MQRASLSGDDTLRVPPLVGPLVRLGGSRPWIALTLLGLVLLVSALMLPRLRVELDVLSLLPDSNENVSAFRQTLEDFGSMDLLLLAVDADDVELEQAREFGSRVAQELRASGMVTWVQFEMADLLESARELTPWALLFASDEELEEIEQRLSPEGLDRAAALLAERLRLPLAGAQTELLRRDPLDLVGTMFDRLRGQIPGTAGTGGGAQGVALSPDGGLLLMVARPVRPAADIVFGEQLMAEIDLIRERIGEGWEDEWGAPPPRLLVSGGPAIAAFDSQQVQGDLRSGSAIALLSVALLFSFAFRRPAALVFAILPLLLGLLLVALAALFIFGVLNAATSIFAAMLIGLGVDYVILLYGRYMDARASGKDVDKAIETISRRTVGSAAVAALTTGSAMFCLMVSRFKGLADLGLLAGLGILLLLLSVCLLLPALLVLSERWLVGRRIAVRRIHGFGFGRLGKWSRSHPKAALTTVGLMTVALALLATRAEYNARVVELRSPDNPASLAQQEIMAAFDTRFTPFLVRIDGSNEAEALRFAKTVDEELGRLVASGELVRMESVASLVPSPERQQAVLDELARWKDAVALVPGRFRASLRDVGLNPEGFDQGLEDSLAALTQDGPLRLGELLQGDLEPLLGRYVAQREGTNEIALLGFGYVAADAARSVVPDGLQKLNDLPGTRVTGPVVVSREIRQVVMSDAIRSGVLALVCVGLVLTVSLGGIVPAVVALLPMVLGTLWLLGWLGLFGVQLNLLNLFVFPMLIGISVDYGVHMVHRVQEGGRAPEIAATSRAIGVATLTTVLGFGSLSLSHFPGLRAMGIVAILGALSAALLAVVLVPALTQLTWKPVDAEPHEAAGPEPLQS